MYVYKPRRGLKRGEESKVRYFGSICYSLTSQFIRKEMTYKKVDLFSVT